MENIGNVEKVEMIYQKIKDQTENNPDFVQILHTDPQKAFKIAGIEDSDAASILSSFPSSMASAQIQELEDSMLESVSGGGFWDDVWSWLKKAATCGK